MLLLLNDENMRDLQKIKKYFKKLLIPLIMVDICGLKNLNPVELEIFKLYLERIDSSSRKFNSIYLFKF